MCKSVCKNVDHDETAHWGQSDLDPIFEHKLCFEIYGRASMFICPFFQGKQLP